MQNLTAHQRAEIIFRLAELLVERQSEILDANQKDLNAAKKADNLSASMISRLALTPLKLKVLSEGLRQIANNSYNLLGKTLKATQVAEDLELRQITVPIGVIMVIFESRPDALPQASLFVIFGSFVFGLKKGKCFIS